VYVVGAPSLADSRRVLIQQALTSMNTSSVDGGLSPHEMVYGVPPGAPGVVHLVTDTSSVAMDDSSAWGTPSAVPLSWGRQNPSSHPDEGVAWQDVADRAARTAWDVAKGLVSPPPTPRVSNLFSDRGDGFSLMHQRRKGENSESMTIDPEYVSSSFLARSIKSGEHALARLTESGEQALASSSSIDVDKTRDRRVLPPHWSQQQDWNLPRTRRSSSSHWGIKTPPPDSDESENELSPAELHEAISESTDMHMIDYSDEDAFDILFSNPLFEVLRQTRHTSLVLFSDGVHGVFFTCDVDTARDHHALQNAGTSSATFITDDGSRPLSPAETATLTSEVSTLVASLRLPCSPSPFAVPIESGEQALLSSSSAEGPKPRTRRPRESRKTPFSCSPPPRDSRHLHFADEDLDAILEDQRQQDKERPSENSVALPKRRRDILSDTEHRLRKERTDGLVEGLRNVRGSSFSPTRRRVTEDFEPPPSSLDKYPDDSDSEDDSTVGIRRLASMTLEAENEELTCDLREVSRVVLTVRQLRRIMAAKESIFKYGIFVPRSERDRVRLVFDGSRQSAETYDETYAPTARQESVRIFHVVCVEESFGIGQYDVPQAFLKAFIDFDIFVYPPKGQAEFEGQVLKLRRALYGGKQSAFLWYKLMNEFILKLGFVASALGKCLYRLAY
jgi:hypothetical protein